MMRQKIEASRELDAQIAREVFGYTLDYEFAEMMFDGAPCVKELRSQDDEWGVLPFYSTDVGDAWQVVDWMRAHVPDYRALRMETVPLGYMVAFYSHKNPLNRIGAFVAAETAPLAICLAALNALTKHETDWRYLGCGMWVLGPARIEKKPGGWAWEVGVQRGVEKTLEGAQEAVETLIAYSRLPSPPGVQKR